MFEGKFHKIGLMLSGKKIVLCNNGPGTTDFGAISEYFIDLREKSVRIE